MHYNGIREVDPMQDQVTIRLPEDLRRALKTASRRMQRKSSEIVRLALREYLGASASGGDPGKILRPRSAAELSPLESGRRLELQGQGT